MQSNLNVLVRVHAWIFDNLSLRTLSYYFQNVVNGLSGTKCFLQIDFVIWKLILNFEMEWTSSRFLINSDLQFADM